MVKQYQPRDIFNHGSLRSPNLVVRSPKKIASLEGRPLLPLSTID